jgi:homoserine O-succinyltransferase
MPLIIEGSRVPTRWLERKPAGRVVPIDKSDTNSASIRIALINNMPDAALEDTELQFFDLLDAASENLPVVVKLFSLSGVPRADRGMRHLNSFYSELEELWNTPFDALIMTGTEPKCADLREEPYWVALTQVLDWAEENTASTILSCLAAHAGVLHGEGIERQRLSDKCFGVFDFSVSTEHPLVPKIGQTVRFPHSRWNEVSSDALRSSGYGVLTESMDAGVDCFVKARKKSLFVHFQGHPEYNEDTLLKEYRRDIKRFLRQERETYPTTPLGYFDEMSRSLLTKFQEGLLRHPAEEALGAFPDSQLMHSLRKVWQASSLLIYRNWLQFVVQSRLRRSTFVAMPTGRPDALIENESCVKEPLRA